LIFRQILNQSFETSCCNKLEQHEPSPNITSKSFKRNSAFKRFEVCSLHHGNIPFASENFSSIDKPEFSLLLLLDFIMQTFFFQFKL